MLQRMSKNQWTAAQTACNWVQTNQQIWSRWIAKVPQSVVSCPVGFGRFFLDASYTCLMCPSGTFNCCPKGFDCPGGSVVKVQTGMWMSNRTDIPTAYVCPNEEACCTHDTCLPQTCNDEFSGLLCNECKDPDSYLWGGSCHKCDSKGGFSFYMVLLGAFICALLLLVLPYEEAPTVELLFFYFQVTRYIFETQVHGILSVPGISTFLSITSLNVDGFVSDCTLPISGVPKLMFSFFLPLLILVYIVAIYFVLKTAQSSVPGAHDFIMKCMPYHMKGESISLICLRAIIVTLTFVIMPLVDSSLLLLQCAKVEGANVLSKMPQVQCFGPDHIGAAAFAIVVIVLMLLVLPSVISYLLYKLWRSDMIKYETEGLSPIQTLFQCLYIIYKPEMFYTMPVTIIEKGFIAILFTMLAHTEKHIQTNAYIMVLSALCATRIYWQPFGNHLEAYLNREIALGILAMIALRQYTDQYGVSAFTLAEIGVVIFLPPLFHVLRWIKGNYSKHRDTILEAVKPGLSIRSGAATTTTRGPKNSITKPSVSIRASNNELSSGGQRR
ncbi:hypothetical protein BDR26DRAFT_851336 [Obelidium mucronatum]|nr:hypothetical protein BDR26DRAFT_851336 [Obelidium mucronatum]